MNRLTFIQRSLAWNWRMHLAVALGVAVAGAVLTGALIIGQSLRGSLRDLALRRLGPVTHALVAPRFFRQELAAETANSAPLRPTRHLLPVILLEASVQFTPPAPAEKRRAGKVQVLGVTSDFWGQFGLPGDFSPPRLNEVLLNQELAAELGVVAGQEILLRLPRPADIPPDSPLGRKTAASLSRQLTVAGILPNTELGGFSLRPNQLQPKNALVALETLQDLLAQDGKINGLFVVDSDIKQQVAGDNGGPVLRPRLADYGLQFRKLENGPWQISSQELLLEDAIVEKLDAWAKRESREPQPALVYLANWISIADDQARVPYSTVAGIDFAPGPPHGPWRDAKGKIVPPLSDRQIAINQWVADDLAAQGHPVNPGDAITLTFFEPESTHGEVAEKSHSFELAAILPMTGPAADKELTPELKGITDQDSLANWDPPFPYFPERVRSTKPNDQDERYWDDWRATPKAFVSLAAAQRLWGSRFGRVTTWRFAARPGETAAELEAELLKVLSPVDYGLVWQPVRDQSLAAAAGTTPFDGLFFGFSLFLILAAILLISLLFRLGLDLRGREMGMQLALGFTPAQVRNSLLAEGSVIAALGAALGVLGGILYAQVMIYGLRTWWLAAVVTPFIRLYAPPATLVSGFLVTFGVAMVTIWWSLRHIGKSPARQLLTGQTLEQPGNVRRAGYMRAVAGWGALAGAVGLIAWGTQLSGEARAGTFFGSGALLLIAGMTALYGLYRGQAESTSLGVTNLATLAWSNASRAAGRSTLTVGLMAGAVFLIVAISAFHLTPPPSGKDKYEGDGGFMFIAESDVPLYANLALSTDRLAKLGFAEPDPQTPPSEWEPAQRAEFFAERADIFPCRVRSGEDASCRNLYKTRQPRVVGIGPRLQARGGFAWGALPADMSPAEAENPWLLLNRKVVLSGVGSDAKHVIPVILDQNTAMYSLQLYGGVGEQFTVNDPTAGLVVYKVVALLKNSLWQGDLLISEQSFRRLFPEVSGYRLFLAAPAVGDDPAVVKSAWEETLGDYGFLLESTRTRLENFMAVQNTYLGTFQTLGGLGLLLGTVGLAVVQLRNVVERRGELALMQAIGFSRGRLLRLLSGENGALLLCGLILGGGAALVAIVPQLWSDQAAVPWQMIIGILTLFLTVGLGAGWLAARSVFKESAVRAIRGGTL
ncbi:MAG: FtsX-like permease family protein [Pirellulales bacterium]|nr:FtsX-like permease family protein [Pirellulales bacterium]